MAVLNILDQINNNSRFHQELVAKIEKKTKHNLICYFGDDSGIVDGAIDRIDVERLENVLRFMEDKYDGKIDFMIHSPGGMPLVAYEMMESLKIYFPSEVRVIVPKLAMSAATLIAMGAHSIVMSDTSKLGPIDPQMVIKDSGGISLQPVWSYVTAYEKLIAGATADITAGLRDSPYLHLLSYQNPQLVEKCIQARHYAKRLAKNLMENGVMKGKSLGEIEGAVNHFHGIGETDGHSRYIRWDEARSWGLKIDYVNRKDSLWDDVWELYTRIRSSMERNDLIKYLLYRDDFSSVSGDETLKKKPQDL